MHDALCVTYPTLKRNTPPPLALGDFNQRVPRLKQPQHVFDELMRTFDGWQFATQGQIHDVDYPVVDHVVLDNRLQIDAVWACSRVAETGEVISDHDGIAVRVRLDSPRN